MSDYLVLALTFLLSFFIVLRVIPKLVAIAIEKNMVDQPNARKLNRIPIPTLGGIGIFLGLVISTISFSRWIQDFDIQYIFAGMTLMLYVGISDDLFDMKASKKLLYQIIAASIVIFAGGLRFVDFHGLFGIDSLPIEVGCLLTLFVYIGLTNALNLIDGIDGLASGFGILASTTLGIIFFLTGDVGDAVICLSTAGALFPFFFFNVFGHKNKIFMGDTGSLILGVLFAAVCVRFANSEPIANLVGPHPVTLLLAIFSVPVFDTIRVMLMRMFKGNSPFQPDKTHLHHRIIQLGFSHWTSTRIILTLNTLVVLFAFTLSNFQEEWQVVSISILSVFVASFPAMLLRYMNAKHPNSLRRLRIIFYKSHKKQAPVRGKLTKLADNITWRK